MNKEDVAKLCCSFCGKSQQKVRKLIAGPSVYICDECIGLCNDIIVEGVDRESGGTPPPEGSPIDGPTALRPGVTAIDEAVEALRRLESRLQDRPAFVSRAVSVLESSVELLRSALEEWHARARSTESEACRQRELQRQGEEATQAWARSRDDWERTRETVGELEQGLRRLRGGLPEPIRREHRLLLEDVGQKLERLREMFDPGEAGPGELPVPPLDPRAWAVPVLVAPHLWRITRALREILRDGERLLCHENGRVLEEVLVEVTTLGEQLGSELRARISRWRAPEIRARLEQLEHSVSSVRQRVPGSLPQPLLRALDDVLEELRSVTSRLAEIGTP